MWCHERKLELEEHGRINAIVVLDVRQSIAVIRVTEGVVTHGPEVGHIDIQ